MILFLHNACATTLASIAHGPGHHASVCFVRHGQSEWNAAHRFTGWTDVDLTELGRSEAASGGAALKTAGLSFDRAFTSELKRAQETLAIVLHNSGQGDTPVMHSWRLNERHYGALQGRSKQGCVDEFGLDQVKRWRNSFDVPPPRVSTHSPSFPGSDPKYSHVPPALLPRGECLRDTQKRALPFWTEHVAPELAAGRNVIIAAHGHSIRALIKSLDRISDSEISSLSIPNGIPLLYSLDAELRPICLKGAAAGLSGVLLQDLHEAPASDALAESLPWTA